MDYEALCNSIKRGVISPVYVFCGTEKILMDKALKRLIEKFLPDGLEAFNLDQLDGEKTLARDIVDLANTVPVMAQKRIVLIDNPPYLQAGKSFKGEFNEKILLDYLPKLNEQACLIFRVIGKVDKRKKILKEMGKVGQIVDFSSLNRNDLYQWIISFFQKENKRIEKEALEYLIIVGNEGLDFLQNELNKLLLFCIKDEKITIEAVREIVANTTEINIFNLIDSIANKQGKKALIQLQTSLANGEAPLKLIYLLVRQFRMMLIAKDLMQQGYSEKTIREKLEVPPFVVNKILGQSHRFSFLQLVQALNVLVETETALKSSGGQMEELMEDVVIRLCYQ